MLWPANLELNVGDLLLAVAVIQQLVGLRRFALLRGTRDELSGSVAHTRDAACSCCRVATSLNCKSLLPSGKH